MYEFRVVLKGTEGEGVRVESPNLEWIRRVWDILHLVGLRLTNRP
jgi:hypothetical protein